jgi:hypothetical protein
MPVYKKEDLLNLEIRSVAGNACRQDLITEEEKEKIFREAPVGFYSPNIFLFAGIKHKRTYCCILLYVFNLLFLFA